MDCIWYSKRTNGAQSLGDCIAFKAIAAPLNWPAEMMLLIADDAEGSALFASLPGRFPPALDGFTRAHDIPRNARLIFGDTASYHGVIAAACAAPGSDNDTTSAG
jgi:hypothetical protein